jgi:hypothetical protein
MLIQHLVPPLRSGLLETSAHMCSVSVAQCRGVFCGPFAFRASPLPLTHQISFNCSYCVLQALESAHGLLKLATETASGKVRIILMGPKLVFQVPVEVCQSAEVEPPSISD